MNHRLLSSHLCTLAGLLALLLTPAAQAQSLDIVFGGNGPNELCENDGTGNFTCTTISASGSFSSWGVAATDVGEDANGDLDLIFANGGGAGVASQVCTNDGSGTFTCTNLNMTHNNRVDVVVGDLDGINGIDLIFAKHLGANERICLNDGSGNFTCSDLSAGINRSVAVDVGDLDGDTDLDIVFSGSVVRNRVCLNDGSANFTCSDVSTDTDIGLEVDIGDIGEDANGDLDLIFSNETSTERVCTNDGAANFTCSDVMPGYDQPATNAGDLGDIDGDGDLDMVFATRSNLRVDQKCINDGSGNFTCSDIDPTIPNINTAIELGDFGEDANGDLDIVTGTGRVCSNDGAANFTCSSITGTGKMSIVVGDFVGPALPQNGIAPVPAASFYWPLDVATVNIDLDDAADLLGVGGKLAYDATRLTFDDGSLAAGAFLDDGSTILFEDDDDAGTASFSVTRTSGTGATGSGTAATMTLTVDDESPPGTATFSLSDLLAVDPAGTPITLTPTDGSFEIGGVWPGDTDNNCTAEAADLLPIGLNFADTGPARPGGFDITWSAKAFSPWGGSSAAPTFSDSFADATGDGEIDQNDVLPIGVNFGETHASTTGCTPAALPKNAAAISLNLDALPVGTVITVHLVLVEQTNGLVGTAIKLAVDPAVLKVNSVAAGDFLNDGDLLNLVRLDDATGLSEAAFTRKGVERAISGTGALAVMTVEVIGPMTTPSALSLSEVKLSTASAGIFEASEQALSLRTDATTSTASEDADEVPAHFTLHGAYPNPFNPATTVSFDLPHSALVTLVVFDVLGREVSRVNAGDVAAGSRQTVRFDAGGLASGTYLYRLEAQTASEMSVQMGRFVLLK